MNSKILYIILGILLLIGISYGGYNYLNTSIDSKIISMQMDLLKGFNSITKQKESGKVSLDFSTYMSGVNSGNIDGKFLFNNYIANSDFLNSQVKGDLSGSLNYEFLDQKNSLRINSFIDIIANEGQTFFRLGDLKISLLDKSVLSSYEEQVKKISDIFKGDKYILLEDNKILYEKISYENMKNILSSPLLKVDRKDGNKHYLIPTKSSCDFIKSFSSKEICSDIEYQELLTSFKKSGEMYINYDIFGDEYLSYTYFLEEKTQLNTKIYFSGKNISKVISNISGNDKINFTFEYISKEKLVLNLNAKEENINLNLNTTLNKDNIVDKGNLDFKIQDLFNSKINLDKGKIEGKTTFSIPNTLTLNIDTNGKYDKNSIDIINNFNSKLDFIGSNISGNFGLKSITSGNNRKDDINIDFNYDMMQTKIKLQTDITTSSEIDKIIPPTNFEKLENIQL